LYYLLSRFVTVVTIPDRKRLMDRQTDRQTNRHTAGHLATA